MDIKTSDLRAAVSLLGHQSGVQTPTVVPSHVQQVMTKSHELGTGISLLVNMTYRSLSGNLKQRDVLIRRVLHVKNEFYIDGIAMDIRAPRLIKVSSIQRIQDLTSLRSWTNPLDFLHNRISIPVGTPEQALPRPADDFAKVVERLGHEMTVLMYLVAIDGTRDKAEREKVLTYIRAQTTNLQYNPADLNDYLISLAPDEDCMTAALAHVLNKPQAFVQPFMEAVLDVITADGRVDNRERAFLIRLMDLLEQDGYTITLPI